MFCLLFASVFAETLIEKINNSPSSTWTAKQYPPSMLTVAKLRARCGLRRSGHKIQDLADSNDVPETFDSRTQWDGVCTVRDQGSCGSCWAFSVSSVFTDRKTVAGTGVGMLSAQDLISCDPYDAACDGGDFPTSLTWMQQTGICTEECMAYASYYERVPSCPSTCNDGSAITRYKISKWTLHTSISSAQNDIYTYGPLSAGFLVYYDFYFYSSGVYQHVFGEYLGAHAIVVLGWGTQSNTKYWLCQNSWGSDWGESGFFKFIRGVDDCGIEDELYASYA